MKTTTWTIARFAVGVGVVATMVACGGAPGTDPVNVNVTESTSRTQSSGTGGFEGCVYWSGNTSFIGSTAVTQTLQITVECGGSSGDGALATFGGGAAVSADGTPNPFSVTYCATPGFPAYCVYPEVLPENSGFGGGGGFAAGTTSNSFPIPESFELTVDVEFRPPANSTTPTQWNSELTLSVEGVLTTIPLTGISGMSATTPASTIDFGTSMSTALSTGAIAPAPSGASQAEAAGWTTTNAGLLHSLTEFGCTGPMWVEPDSSKNWWLVSMCPADGPHYDDSGSCMSGIEECPLAPPLLLTAGGFEGIVTPTTAITSGSTQWLLSESAGPAYALDMFLDYSGSAPLVIPAPSGYVFVYYGDPNCSSGVNCVAPNVRTEAF